VIVAVVQLPVLFAVHVPLALIAPPDASLMSHVPVPLASQAEPWIWKVQIDEPLPVSFTMPAVALFQAHAGLAPAVARYSKARLIKIAKYPAALCIFRLRLPFLRDGPNALGTGASRHDSTGGGPGNTEWQIE